MLKLRQYLFAILSFQILANATASCSKPPVPITLTPTASEPISTNTPMPSPTLTPTSLPTQITSSTLSMITVENAENLARISELYQATLVRSLVFSPDGKYLFVGCADETSEAFVNIWDVATGLLIRTLNMGGRFLEDLSISPDGKTLAVASVEGTPSLWDISSGGRLVTIDGHDEVSVISVSYSPTGKSLAYGYAMLGFLHIWSLEENKTMYDVRADIHDVVSIAYTADGERIISGGWEGTVRIWNATTGDLIRNIDVESEPKTEGNTTYVDSYAIKEIATTAKGQMALVGCGKECIVQIRDIDSGALINQVSVSGDEWVFSKPNIVFNPNGTILGIGSCLELDSNWNCTSTEVVLTDMVSTAKIKVLKNSGSMVAISPDGKFIATGSDDGVVQLFGVANP